MHCQRLCIRMTKLYLFSYRLKNFLLEKQERVLYLLKNFFTLFYYIIRQNIFDKTHKSLYNYSIVKRLTYQEINGTKSRNDDPLKFRHCKPLCINLTCTEYYHTESPYAVHDTVPLNRFKCETRRHIASLLKDISQGRSIGHVYTNRSLRHTNGKDDDIDKLVGRARGQIYSVEFVSPSRPIRHA